MRLVAVVSAALAAIGLSATNATALGGMTQFNFYFNQSFDQPYTNVRGVITGYEFASINPVTDEPELYFNPGSVKAEAGILFYGTSSEILSSTTFTVSPNGEYLTSGSLTAYVTGMFYRFPTAYLELNNDGTNYFSGGIGAYNEDGFNGVTYVAAYDAPEPSQWILMTLGIGIAGGAMRFVRRRIRDLTGQPA